MGENPAQLKVELALRGLKLDAALRARLFEPGEVRVDHALDLLLPEDVWVQAPIDQRWTTASPFTLAADGTRFSLRRGANASAAAPAEPTALDVRVITPPDFYRRRTTSGAPMVAVGEVH